MPLLAAPLDPAIVASLYREGLSREAVAARLGVSSTPVRRILNALGIMRPRAAAALVGSTKYAVNAAFFGTIDTLSALWALGWFYADGYNRVTPPDARITLNEGDEEVLVKLSTLFGNTRPLQREPRYHRTSLIVSRRRFSEDLARHGCVQRKSLIVQYPHHLLDTKAKTCAFLRGVIEGDGCIHIDKDRNGRVVQIRVTIASGSPAFVDALTAVVQSYWGLSACLQWRGTREKVTGVRFGGAREQMRQMLLDIYDLKAFDLYLDRKYRQAMQAIAILDDWIAHPPLRGPRRVNRDETGV